MLIGDGDSHLGVGGALVGRVGFVKGGGYVAKRCHHCLGVFLGELGTGLAAEEGLETAPMTLDCTTLPMSTPDLLALDHKEALRLIRVPFSARVVRPGAGTTDVTS